MSASSEWTEWHLTPTGWVMGTEKTDGAAPSVVAPPAGRVLTCKYYERLSSMYSKSLDKGATELWRSNDAAAVQALLDRFGPCPERL